MKKILAVLVIVAMALTLCACGESTFVSRNISKEADNFNVTRRITVFNTRTDTPLWQMTGKFSIKNNSTNELAIIVEVEKGVYQKHFVELTSDVTYIVEDLTGTAVSPYSYELEFLPQTLLPVRITAHEITEDITN